MTSSPFTLTEAITALVTEKRAVGFKYVAEERVLARFAAFCRTEFGQLDVPTKASVEAWIAAAQRRGVRPATVQSLVAPVRELARWLHRRGAPAYVLPAGTLPKPARYVPHIYTDSELAALFSQTDRCHYDAQVPLRHLVMPVLFRTIYACGLRASRPACCAWTTSTSTPGSYASETPRAARTGKCPSANRYVPGSPTTTPASPDAAAGTGSSPAGPGSH
jgi:site-specific recombinase XerD